MRTDLKTTPSGEITSGTVPSILCTHCGSPVKGRSSEFCCHGCETVHAILTARGLREYYELKKIGTSLRAGVPAPESEPAYAYMDDPEFLKLYASNAGTSGERQMNFYLEGVHCVACVWLLEKLPEFVQGVVSVHIDMTQSTAKVVISPEAAFSKVAAEFHRLGYRPHPVRGGEIEELRKRENRLMLIRVAVAGACMGNIMLLAISVYAGAAGRLAQVFDWLSFAIFLPVLLFSAVPFYRDAWTSLRLRTISIDVPIVLGIVLGAGASFLNLLRGSAHLYFDSLAALVFLLLTSRYVLKRAQQNAFQSAQLIHFLTPSVVRRRSAQNGLFEEISLEFLKPGDVVEVRSGESIPIDGTVVHGSSTLSCALLTGEADPIPVGVGLDVYAGTTNLEAPIEVAVHAFGYSTRLGKILKAVEEGIHRKAPIVTLADRAARIFVAVVIAVAAGVFLWSLGLGFQAALERALALVIVTCPCALALATPLALTLSIGRAAKNGILIKGADTLERLSQVQEVFLDKTGTLTTGKFSVLSWIALSGTDEAARVACALERKSNHPIARAILARFENNMRDVAEVTDFRETIGQGVSGRIDGHLYEIRRSEESLPAEKSGSRVSLYKDGAVIAHAILGDAVRDDSSLAVEKLRTLGLSVHILSGDSNSAARRVAAQVGISPQQTIGEASPELKNEIIRRYPNALMAGDGANDSLALSSASVGVAVHGGMEVSLKAADIYLSRNGVTPIYRLVVAGRESMRVIRRNLYFSLAYNVAGGLAAILGWVNPLFAAVLMPLSAFTVLLSSLVGTRELRSALKEDT